MRKPVLLPLHNDLKTSFVFNDDLEDLSLIMLLAIKANDKQTKSDLDKNDKNIKFFSSEGCMSTCKLHLLRIFN